MKLSRTGWNNVIIFSVMIIILLINATNDKLFPNDETDNKSEQLILPQHAVVLTLAINYTENEKIIFERVGRSWQLTTQGLMLEKSEQQIEQMMFSWQQSIGLVQAADVVIENDQGVKVDIALAGEPDTRSFMLYPLSDQLLVHKQQENLWLALPAALAQQLLPMNI